MKITYTYSLRVSLSLSASVVIWPLWWFFFHTVLVCTWRVNLMCTCCCVKKLSLARVRIRSFLAISELDTLRLWNRISPCSELWQSSRRNVSLAGLSPLQCLSRSWLFFVHMFTFSDEVCKLSEVPLSSLLCSNLQFLVMECPSVCHQGSLGDCIS